MEQSPHRILLVEDNPGDARLLRETLADAAGPDLEIVAVETLGAALEAVKAASYDLLLVDLSLPDSQGLATVDQLYHAALDTPVVVMTGLDDEAVGIEAVRKGAQDYLIKGRADGQTIFRAVHYAIERHRVLTHLRRQSRMQAVGRLTAGVAHEFNNLLAAIIGNLELIELRPELESGTRQVTKNATAVAWRAAQLVSSLRSFSEMQILQPRAIDTGCVTRDVATLVQSSLDDNVRILLELPVSPLWALADPGQLQEAIYQLMANARDALAEGGELTVRIAARTVDPAPPGSEPAAGDYAAITVADNGIGMSRDVVSRAFEPFFTTKEVGKGTGLGLSMVHGFARQSHGFAELSSEPGRGTTATLVLPVTSAPA
jgi:signal transduction histidine kinase